MSEEKRRLAAILAADIFEYSAMVTSDEPTTLARVRLLRTDIIEPLAARHDGRLFKTMGDGFLLEFASAVQALRCATAIQHALRAQTDGLRLRIGVHQSEVVPEGEDLLGDGVIIAARLEPLAEPGGIVISARVKEDAAGTMMLEVDDLGEPPLKNIAARIRTFRVRLGAPGAAPDPPRLGLPDKPSIAVLAFANISSDPDQEYFSDGMAEDIITKLSLIRALFVIARNSSFTYKGRAVDVKQIGYELGVRYILEGSVRRAGERVRITAQLVEAETGNHIWAQRFDRALSDVFAVQDEISDSVASAIGPAVADAEMRRAMRRPQSPELVHARDRNGRYVRRCLHGVVSHLLLGCAPIHDHAGGRGKQPGTQPRPQSRSTRSRRRGSTGRIVQMLMEPGRFCRCADDRAGRVRRRADIASS